MLDGPLCDAHICGRRVLEAHTPVGVHMPHLSPRVPGPLRRLSAPLSRCQVPGKPPLPFSDQTVWVSCRHGRPHSCVACPREWVTASGQLSPARCGVCREPLESQAWTVGPLGGDSVTARTGLGWGHLHCLSVWDVGRGQRCQGVCPSVWGSCPRPLGSEEWKGLWEESLGEAGQTERFLEFLMTLHVRRDGL